MSRPALGFCGLFRPASAESRLSARPLPALKVPASRPTPPRSVDRLAGASRSGLPNALLVSRSRLRLTAENLGFAHNSLHVLPALRGYIPYLDRYLSWSRHQAGTRGRRALRL